MGRNWFTMWEDGQSGIFRMSTSQQTGVKRRHQLLSSDDMALTDNLLEKTAEHTRKAVLHSHKTLHITNKPKMLTRGCAPGVLEAESFDETATVAGGADPAGDGKPRANLAPVPEDDDDSRCVFDAMPKSTLDVLSAIKAVNPAAPEPKVKAKAKAAAAKATPKATAKAAASSRAKGQNQGQNQPQSESGVEASVSKALRGVKRGVESLQPASVRTARGVSVADSIAEADRQWLEANQVALKQVLTTCAEIPDESKTKTCISEANKAANKLLTAVRTRKRTIKRRVQGQEGPLEDVTVIETTLTTFTDLLSLLSNKGLKGAEGNVGDQCYAKVVSLMDAGACFADSILLNIARLMWTDDLRFQRWGDMQSVTLKFAERVMPDKNCAKLMTQQMNLVLQKLMKGIAVEHVTLDLSSPPDGMEPLLDFLTAMSKPETLPDAQTASDFADLLYIIKATSTNPADTTRAIQSVLSDSSSDRPILASFNALAQGKKFLELADEFANAKLESNRFLTQLDSVRVECTAFTEAVDNHETEIDISAMVDESLRVCGRYLAACKGPEPASDPQSVVAISMAEARTSVIALLVTSNVKVCPGPLVRVRLTVTLGDCRRLLCGASPS